MIKSRGALSDAKRVVVKIGSSLLTDGEEGVRQDVIDRLVDELVVIMQGGRDIVVVTSGSVSLGRVQLGWLKRELTVHEKQAAAAVGQPILMRAYSESFARHQRSVAQLLLTKDDLSHRRRYLNASNTSETLFSVGVVPIVNENDTVVVKEIKFGDNDNLGALVSLVVEGDLLVMMTDVDGLYDANPFHHSDAQRISEVTHVDEEHEAMAGDVDSCFGTGGMGSKLAAARVATKAGVAAAIISGKKEGSLTRLLNGDDEGTLFLCGVDRQSRRKHWIAELLPSVGTIHVDQGASKAIVAQGCSLLPAGVVAVEGQFDKGGCVEICGPAGMIGRGLSNFTAREIRGIMGKSSHDIPLILGYDDFDSLIHRDNLVLRDDKQQDG
ncbi:MAG: glutamate 5-kinase [Mariprofundus sp.]|nr:glutamate 5-kinase [Mariprofundus sp.]